MAYKIVLEKRAFREVDNAMSYYHTISPKLAVKLNSELQKSFKTLSKSPFFKVSHNQFRILPLKKFPFVIIFEVDENNMQVSIFAVFNTNQDPNKKP
jgi:mRNA-degrading endonuclease RelE of RelBE toxin-antitoxin system